MTRPMSSLVVACVATMLAITTPTHELGAQTPVHFSVAGGLGLPLSDLGDGADLGLNLALRIEGRPHAPNWGVRGDVSYDRFDGRGGVNEYSYLGFGANLVHRARSGRMYQFGGLGLYNSRVEFTNSLSRTDTNLGVQMGLGFDLTADRGVFTEFGLTSAFTSGRNSLWVPVRVGLRF